MTTPSKEEKEYSAEVSLIGGIIGDTPEQSNSLYAEAAERLKAEDFLDIRCQATWMMFARMHEQGIPINLETIGREAARCKLADQVGDAPAFFHDCIQRQAPVEMAVGDIVESRKRRKLLFATSELMQAARDKSKNIDEALAAAEEMLLGQDLISLEVVYQKKAVELFTEDLDRRIANQGKLQGIATGLVDLDWRLDGLQKSEMTVIAARPSQGKTALGINIMEYACYHNSIPTLFVTMEMRIAAILRRMSASVCDISLSDLRRGTLSDLDQDALKEFAGCVRKSPLYWVESVGGGIDCKQLCATIRRTVVKHDIQLVIVDYLQKVSGAGKHEKRTYEVGESSSALKACADRTGTAFVVLAQLNRESVKQEVRYPRLSDIGDSKQIEQDADTIVMIHKDATDEALPAKLIVAKQRDGTLGIVDVNWNGSRGKFTTHRKRDQEPAG